MRARRTVVAVLVPVAAAVVCAAVVLVLLARDDEPAPRPAGAVRVPLLTGPALAEEGDSALVLGRLARDDRGCVVLTSRDARGGGGGDRTVAWPGGWTAYDVDGRLELRDGTGEVRARQGDWVEAGGGALGRGSDVAGACASAPTFVVQSEPEVVASTEVELLTGGARPGTGPSRVLSGTLVLQRGCLTLNRGDERRLTVWPQGWTAGTDPDGVSVLRDPGGVVRATTGEPVRVTGTLRGAFAYGGSYRPAPRLDPAACGRGAVFVRGVEQPEP